MLIISVGLKPPNLTRDGSTAKKSMSQETDKRGTCSGEGNENRRF